MVGVRWLVASAFLSVAFAQTTRFEAGVQVGVLDERDAIGEKPAIAGGRVTVRALPYLDCEFEVNRFPIGGGQSSFPGTEVFYSARVAVEGELRRVGVVLDGHVLEMVLLHSLYVF